MVRVLHHTMSTANEALNAFVEVIEPNVKVGWVPAGWLKAEPECLKNPNGHQCQALEANERRLLGELIDGRVSSCKDGYSVGAVDSEIPHGVGP